MSIEHIYLSRLVVINEQYTAFAKAQMSGHRSDTICVVVERHDHHCGDDLVSKMVRYGETGG